jgi:hypothetical protein
MSRFLVHLWLSIVIEFAIFDCAGSKVLEPVCIHCKASLNSVRRYSLHMYIY